MQDTQKAFCITPDIIKMSKIDRDKIIEEVQLDCQLDRGVADADC